MWNKITNSRAFYIVVSILCAVCAWLYVDIVEVPDQTKHINNIPVTFVGEDILADQGLMIVDGKESSVSLTVSGPRSALSKIDRTNTRITVQAASQIHGAGSYSLTYSVDYPVSGVSTKTQSTRRIEVEVVQMESKELPLQGVFEGTAVEGALYSDQDFQFEVPNITVTGERSVIETVTSARVRLEAMDLSTTWSGDLPVELLDENGQVLDPKKLHIAMSDTMIYTIFPIQIVKEVPLVVEFIPGGGATEENVTYSISPAPTVTISGTPEMLSTIDSITLGSIKLSDIVTSDIFSFSINTPEGVKVISGNGTASVVVAIDGLVTRTIDTNNIELINKPDGYQVKPVTENLTVRIRGTTDVMELVLDKDVYVTVDLANLKDLSVGKRTLNAKVAVHGSASAGAIGEYQVVVDITKD